MDSAKSSLYKDKPLKAKQAIRGLLVFAAIYCLLLACWPVVGKVYSRMHRLGATFLFGSFGTNGVVRFGECNVKGFDTEITLYNFGRATKSGVAKKGWSYKCRRTDYMYVVFLIALIVATPISVRRKLPALVSGILLIYCFIAAKLAAWVIDSFSKEPLCLFSISPFWEKGFYVFYNLMQDITFGFVAAAFIWILVSFRREDWANIVSGEQKSVRIPLRPVAKAKMGRA
ncbi:MAG: hypothetical protein WBL85_12040 [Sedimentisphaerales bacterium]